MQQVLGTLLRQPSVLNKASGHLHLDLREYWEAVLIQEEALDQILEALDLAGACLVPLAAHLQG